MCKLTLYSFYLLLSSIIMLVTRINCQYFPIPEGVHVSPLDNQRFTSCMNRPEMKSTTNNCVQDANENWNVHDYNPSDYPKASCCAAWDYQSCIVKASYNKCGQPEAASVQRYIDAVAAVLNKGQCKDYQRDSYCRFPWWGILLIVVGSLLVIGVVAFFVYRKVKTDRYQYYR